MNVRNCGGSEALTPTLYCTAQSGDVAACAEGCVPCSAYDHHAYVRSCCQAPAGIGQVAPHGVGDGVVLLGPVKNQGSEWWFDC